MAKSKFKNMLLIGVSAFFLHHSQAWAEKFTIGVISDTQNYTDVTYEQPRGVNAFIQQMRYIVDHKEDKNIVFVTHVGDIVQHGDGRFKTGIVGQYTYWDTRAEWEYANLALSILSKSNIPFSVVPGNHDYDNYSWYEEPNGPGKNRPLKGGSVFNHYFGPNSQHFYKKDWYGGTYWGGLNSFQIFEAAGKKFLHLGLEQQPNMPVLNWAQNVLDNNPGLPVIITTHEWLTPDSDNTHNLGGRDSRGVMARSNDHASYFSGTDHLTPDEIWERFVKKNARIFLILSGHSFTVPVSGVSSGENLRIDTNDAGYPVYQSLQDYQGNTVGKDGKANSDNGGAGWMRFIEFDTDKQKMHFYTYSTLLNKYAGRNGERTFGVDPKYSDFVLDFPPQLSN
ncbi:metallophosphoesterase [Bartonella tamiae]|uniref:Calcineurin-like phosphoesterase domain-containing protein n=1 Tax=Bartonella tamiae Th239 TaxID=1094558 RepID=J1JVX8_9HYPH|nr:metallophosphoesterase [Bartonella tamiae]EJF89142.1 hypothetical protein ME5_01693 [Bartonella tamiae Th239]EJF95455.1 hypothetical protein MEG_00188 [Bartonella tamiae Th307]